MKITIIGQKQFAVDVLTRLKADGHKILAALAPSEEDRFFIAAAGGATTALTHGGRIVAEDIADGSDVIVAAYAHAFITKEARKKARLGAIGYHPSLLPLHRGRDAVRWAVHARERVTGGTVYQMDDGADTGDVIRQEHCFIYPDDTPQTLWRRDLHPLGVRLLSESISLLEAGLAAPKPQDERLATWEPAFCGGRLSG